MAVAGVGGFGVLGCFEAVSPGGLVRVRVGRDGRTVGVGLSSGAMALSAAELAADIVCVNVLAYMWFELAQNLRARDELVAYARFVATCCGRHRRCTGAVAARGEARGAGCPAGAQEYGELAGRVLARVKRIEALLAARPVNGESASDAGEVVVSVDSAGRMTGLSLAPGCTTCHSTTELEELINSTLEAADASAAVSRQSIPARTLLAPQVARFQGGLKQSAVWMMNAELCANFWPLTQIWSD